MSPSQSVSTVLVETTGAIGRITLNAPERLNAVDPQMCAAVSDAVRRLRVTCASSPPPSKRPVKSKNAGGREKSIPTSLPPL